MQLLEEAEKASFAVLDEIGGIELLCPKFREALETLLQSGIPCIGVMKGTGPGSQMIRKLGLDKDYELAAESLRARLWLDRETLLYECSQFDPEALRLAQSWVSEFVRKDTAAILRP